MSKAWKRFMDKIATEYENNQHHIKQAAKAINQEVDSIIQSDPQIKKAIGGMKKHGIGGAATKQLNNWFNDAEELIQHHQSNIISNINNNPKKEESEDKDLQTVLQQSLDDVANKQNHQQEFSFTPPPPSQPKQEQYESKEEDKNEQNDTQNSNDLVKQHAKEPSKVKELVSLITDVPKEHKSAAIKIVNKVNQDKMSLEKGKQEITKIIDLSKLADEYLKYVTVVQKLITNQEALATCTKNMPKKTMQEQILDIIAPPDNPQSAIMGGGADQIEEGGYHTHDGTPMDLC